MICIIIQGLQYNILQCCIKVIYMLRIKVSSEILWKTYIFKEFTHFSNKCFLEAHVIGII